jgi:hypothetical protein
VGEVGKRERERERENTFICGFFIFHFLFSLGFHLLGWYHPYSGWAFLLTDILIGLL